MKRSASVMQAPGAPDEDRSCDPVAAALNRPAGKPT